MPDDLEAQSVTARIVKASGIKISVVGTMPDKQLIQLETVLNGGDTADVNGLLDELLGSVDRQMARYSLEARESEFNKAGVALGTMIAALPIAEANHIAAKEKLAAEIEEQEKSFSKQHAEAEAAWRSSGRRGEYEPAGRTKANLERIAKSTKGTLDKIAKLDAEHKQNIALTVNNILDAREKFAVQREKLNALRETAGLTPIKGFEDLMTCALPSLEA